MSELVSKLGYREIISESGYGKILEWDYRNLLLFFIRFFCVGQEKVFYFCVWLWSENLLL